MKYYHRLDFPQIPADLEPPLLSVDQLQPIWSNNHLRSKYAEIKQAAYDRCSVSTELEQWIRLNCRDDFVNVGLTYSYDSKTMFPHTDITRRFTLLYPLATGGDSVETRWYQQQGQPLYRKSLVTLYTYDELTLLESVVFQPRVWYILDAGILHSVEGMTEPRVTIQVGFNEDSTWAMDLFR